MIIRTYVLVMFNIKNDDGPLDFEVPYLQTHVGFKSAAIRGPHNMMRLVQQKGWLSRHGETMSSPTRYQGEWDQNVWSDHILIMFDL